MAMLSVESFDISLEHDIDEQYQYQPGEVLRGVAILKLKGQLKVKCLGVQIKGEANVSWTLPGRKGRSRDCTAHEIYINVMKTLIDPYGGEVETLSMGTHDFPFQYRLPYGLPSSFIGKYGSITYVVKATIQGESTIGLSAPMITSEPFLCIRTLDIAKESSLIKPYFTGRTQRIFGILCDSGIIDIQFEANRQVHLPGEDITMSCVVNNNSPRLVTAIQANINMINTFYAQKNAIVNTQVVNKKRDEWEMDTGEGRKWKSVHLTVPPYIPESRLDGCDIIDTRYELQFLVEIHGRRPIEIVIPLLIGTDGIPDEDLNVNSDVPVKTRTRIPPQQTPMQMWRPVDSNMTREPNYHKNNENGNNDLPEKIPIDDITIDPDFEDVLIGDFDYGDENIFDAVMGNGTVRKNPLYSSVRREYLANSDWITQDEEEDETTRL